MAEVRCDHRARLARLQAMIGDDRGLAAEVDLLVVSTRSNVRYLSGFTGSAGSLVVSADSALLVTDGRYVVQASRQLEECELSDVVAVDVAHRGDVVDAVGYHLLAPTAVGLEAANITWAVARSLSERWGGISVVPTEGIVEDLRMIKDAGEIDRLGRACAIADDSLAEVLSGPIVGRTERDVAAAIDRACAARGSEAPSFETIVASGPNSALPHARPSDRVIERSDPVVIDMGAVVDGYHSDMTRTVFVGAASGRLVDAWDAVVDAQRLGRDACVAGIRASVVDEVCRDRLGELGWGEFFSHGTGHGIGLDIHESPRVAATSDATLAAGHVVTVEPGVYVEGLGGVRIEDSLLVGEAASRRLTHTPIVMVVDD